MTKSETGFHDDALCGHQPRLQVMQGGPGEPLPVPDLVLRATHRGACSAGAEDSFDMADLPKAAAEVPDGAEEAFP
ncbi:hypothetical protein [Azospirillum melinis]